MNRRLALSLIPLAILLALGAVFAWPLLTGRDPGELPSQLIDEPAPATELPPPAGLDVPGISAATLSAEPNKVVLVNFFASWCVPCRAEHPALTTLAAREDVTLVGINYKDKPADVRAFIDELGNPFAAIGADASGRTGIDWGITGVPETFVLDAAGRVRYRHLGPLTPENMRERLIPAIEAASR